VIDRFRGEYAFLSNFAHSPIEVSGLVFPSVEHAYQAAKISLSFSPDVRLAMQQGVARLATASLAKKAGRSLVLRRDWFDVRLPIMERLLRLKFELPTRMDRLRETAPHDLVEGNDWHDTFWGVCRGEGANHLGRLLMKIRDEQP
jgi:ribA/ribD-fused uncharacterized protein